MLSSRVEPGNIGGSDIALKSNTESKDQKTKAFTGKKMMEQK
jgi:hypothetical protein